MRLDLFWECETLRGENDKKNPLSTIFDTLNQENNAWKTLASLQSNEWQDHKNTTNYLWKKLQIQKTNTKT